MANTRNIIGDQATVDGLISNTLGVLEEDSITSLADYALYRNCGITTAIFPNLEYIGKSAFDSAKNLCHLVLGNSTLCDSYSNASVGGTPISTGVGWIYVPTSLIDTYKNNSKWSAYSNQIVSISEYPKALQLPYEETISDSWETIFSNEDNGTYKSVYSLGDIKYMSLNGIQIPMQIVAFDEDESKISWLSKNLLPHSLSMYPSTVFGWETSKVRSFLQNVIYPLIDSTVKNHIVPVTKISGIYYNNKYVKNGQTTIDTLWIPSVYEVLGNTSAEDEGTLYTDVLSTNDDRKKTIGLSGSSNDTWWTRSVYSSTYFHTINYYGSKDTINALYEQSIPLGFCT